MKIRREAKKTKGKNGEKHLVEKGKKKTEEIRRSLLKLFIFTTFPWKDWGLYYTDSTASCTYI